MVIGTYNSRISHYIIVNIYNTKSNCMYVGTYISLVLSFFFFINNYYLKDNLLLLL